MDLVIYKISFMLFTLNKDIIKVGVRHLADE